MMGVSILVEACERLLWRIRAAILCFLLSYHGWMRKPKSWSTKIWAFMVASIGGRRNRGVFGYQEALPSLPVPDLSETLRKYLDSVRPLLSSEDYERTVQVVRKFQNEEGPSLQHHLKLRALKHRNWLEEWWLKVAYLRPRTPVLVNSNIYCLGRRTTPTPHRLNRAANVIYWSARLRELIRAKTLPSFRTMNIVPVCNHGYEFCFGSCRIPGEVEDHIKVRSDTRHVVISCKGHYYRADLEVEDGSLVTPQEWVKILQQIEDASSEADKRGIAAMTSQERSRWAKQYKELRQRPINNETMEVIETAQWLVSLSDASPKDLTEISDGCMKGGDDPHYSDKVLTYVVFANGRVGTHVEHSPLDATIWARIWEHILQNEEYTADGDLPESPAPLRDLPPAQRLKWDLDGFEDALAAAKQHRIRLISDVDNKVVAAPFGKRIMKALKVSPDGFVQMSLQLAFYRVHKRLCLTYESASTRMFYHGRTDTIRPVSDVSLAFCKMAVNESAPRSEVRKNLLNAIRVQTERKIDAVCGLAIDRHLLGLYLTSLELGMKPPGFFTDKAWSLPFELSTSQTPTKFAPFYVDEKCAVGGGFGPVVKQGYGFSYIFVGEDEINFFISSMHSAPDTDSLRLANAVCDAMVFLRDLLAED